MYLVLNLVFLINICNYSLPYCYSYCVLILIECYIVLMTEVKSKTLSIEMLSPIVVHLPNTQLENQPKIDLLGISCSAARSIQNFHKIQQSCQWIKAAPL